MSTNKQYRGIIVPMITPLNEDFTLDTAGTKRIIEHVVSNGCMPFVAGTTGESASLSKNTKEDLVRATVEQTDGRQPVFAGISGNCFESSLEAAVRYQELGADVAVAHLPCYYPIGERQMRKYFVTLADQSPLPLVLYNIPVTTGLSVPVELLDELSHHRNIVAVKDSERGEDRLAKSLSLWSGRDDFAFHLGWAAMSAHGFRNGLDGSVPSSGNLVPELYRRIFDAAAEGDHEEAERLQEITNAISDYYQAGYPLSESIPIFKAMLEGVGLCKRFTAPPMLSLDSRETAKVVAESKERFGAHFDIAL
jgi:4-hydroxy-tetrahydrodipicolinate synthase